MGERRDRASSARTSLVGVSRLEDILFSALTAERIELGDPLRMVASRHSHWKPMAFRYRLLGGEIQDTTNIRRLGNGESA